MHYTLAYGRNLNDEDVDLSRSVIVIGKMVEKRLFPARIAHRQSDQD